MNLDPIFQRFFIPEYLHKASINGKVYNFEFANATLADLPIKELLYLNSEQLLIPELSCRVHAVDVGYAISEAFLGMSSRGNLVGTVAILLSKKPLKTYKQIAEIRVETGRLQLANGDFSQHVEALLKKHKIEESSNLFDLIETGDLTGSSLTNIEKTDFSYSANIDGITFVEIDSGYGDGTYPVFLAYDSDGVACALYIDFLLFDRKDILEQLTR